MANGEWRMANSDTGRDEIKRHGRIGVQNQGLRRDQLDQGVGGPYRESWWRQCRLIIDDWFIKYPGSIGYWRANQHRDRIKCRVTRLRLRPLGLIDVTRQSVHLDKARARASSTSMYLNAVPHKAKANRSNRKSTFPFFLFPFPFSFSLFPFRFSLFSFPIFPLSSRA